MNTEMEALRAVFSRYRKIVVVAGFSILGIAGLLVFGAGILVYNGIGIANEKVKELRAEDVRLDALLPEPGLLEGVVLDLAGSWLEHSLAGAEVRPVRDGLSCFDALGGPSPVELVNYVKSRSSDQQFLAHLHELKEKLTDTAGTPSGAAACTSWLFNG